ncbi:hypothetical protein OLX02_05215 [Novosphingobium sp. KCTC 2891]|uniref:hypothetical protein n=1 Tax=Novosphingobium sp. KCTC 2891 TaxID=2989730 RepID=UPI002223DB87|nr:hypothetical protein [Novosphingobium sp. KCTC 2891]MCW1382213.1 hypothetical protein [Novosphingobium sp. KCTC 2891]
MITTFIIALAANAAASTSASGTAITALELDPRKMSQSQVRAHNASRIKTDPDYIRCVKSEDTGSLVRKRVSCRTNAMWEQADRVGNQNARETYEAMQGKAINQAN